MSRGGTVIFGEMDKKKTEPQRGWQYDVLLPPRWGSNIFLLIDATK